MAANDAYKGETWKIPAETLGGRSGTVEIEIKTKNDKRFTSVTATFPADGTKRARWVKEVKVPK